MRAALALVAVGLTSSIATAQFKAKPIAVVNGEAVPREAWEEAVKKLPAPPPGVSPEARKAAAMQVLALMIDDVLLKQFLVKNAAPATPAAVQQRLTQLETALRANKKTLQDYCKETGLTEAKLKAGIASEIQWQTFLSKRVSLDDLKKYYSENKEMFDGAKIRVSQIVYTIPPGDARVEGQAKEVMDQVRMELLKGADFAELAKKYSHDKLSGPRGGDLGWFPPRKSDTDQFIRTASTMKKGEVSGLVRTEYGLHIIRVADFQEGKSSSFEEVQEAVKEVYADELKVAIILQQRREAKIELND
jgi:parvulin-like peptidyl-prolyl isomerase